MKYLALFALIAAVYAAPHQPAGPPAGGPSNGGNIIVRVDPGVLDGAGSQPAAPQP